MFVARCKRSSHGVTFVYVSIQSGLTVSVIDGATNTFVAAVSVDIEPLPSSVGVNEADDRVYVVNFGVDELGLGTVSVIGDDVTPEEAVLDLVENVEDIGLPRGIETSLTSKLLSANTATWLAAN